MADKVEVNSQAVRDLMRSLEVRSDLERRAQAMRESAGEGFEVVTREGPNRVHVEVQTTTPEAMLAEATDKRLTRAIDAGRL